ncbi:hypothetical protein BD626DRAFT_636665 [Schizophyllum amplum]|uniref:Uncharacterized protein n=1 Tax=Schizophyllum amplum TaxID=97359 RepID=A0A550BT27_9AGAR|nr:hypothetical protein BD626DRAFT_636665 [Auriculariopsis ampla]
MSRDDPPTRALATDTASPSSITAFVPAPPCSTSEELSSRSAPLIENLDADMARMGALRQPVADLQLRRAAPVYRLPAELLSEIFIYLAESDFLGYNSRKEGEHYAAHLIAVTVAYVCVFWRATALGTPRLWSRIRVGYATRHLDAYVGTCVKLSKQHTLDIHCTSSMHMPAVVALTLPHAQRWGSICLHGLFEDFCSIPLGHHFARLREADLAIDPPIDDEARAFEFLADAPSLRRVEVYGVTSSDYEPTKLPSSWELTRLQVDVDDRCRVRPLVAMFAQYQATLENLACMFDDYIPHGVVGEGVIDPIQFPALRSIELSVHAFRLLPYIIAPNIRNITLINMDEDKYSYTCLLAFLIFPSASPLRHLRRLSMMEKHHFNDSEDASFTLLACLALMDDLQELKIECTAAR